MSNERLFKGTYGIVLTPFKDDFSVDYKTLENHLEKAIESSLDGLVVCGSTGEFSRMRPEENMQVMSMATEVNAGRKQIICGATGADSYSTNKYVEHINRIGGDGALIAPPYYFPLTDEEIAEFYIDVSRNNVGNVPIVAYNIPQCTDGLSYEVFERIMELPDVKGMKNSWHDMQTITMEIDFRNKYRPDVSMLTGLDACLYGTLALGGDGEFTAIAYLLPDFARIIVDEFGKSSKSYECQCDLLRLIKAVGEFSFPYGYRVLSDVAGFPLGRCREVVSEKIKIRSDRAYREMMSIIRNLNEKYLNK